MQSFEGVCLSSCRCYRKRVATVLIQHDVTPETCPVQYRPNTVTGCLQYQGYCKKRRTNLESHDSRPAHEQLMETSRLHFVAAS
ncbi:unnamed protein product [Chondrus crispus]|uniref:Uncharacterized protein n=1 Tax=Chondrus crispus TaxID=2769 RepID=R7Q8U8_CHOCR|nr:unnamed protein product [Chondrus crispus]CDF34228.1 unnamed protein product [Chondrus crispus]|eukprot:XP_005714047.1 unnamed protein product [Chondrus crispus]